MTPANDIGKKPSFCYRRCVQVFALTATALLVAACSKHPSIIWQREFCKGRSKSAAPKVIATSQRTFVLAYAGNPSATKCKSFVMEIGESGDSLWSDSLQHALITAIRPLNDGSFVAVGQMEWDNSLTDSSLSGFLTRWSPERKQQWTRTYLLNENTWFSDVQTTSDGGYVLCGLTQSRTIPLIGILLLKVNSDGDTLWSRVHNITSKFFERRFHVQQMPDGGYAILASIAYDDSARQWNCLVIRTDEQGDRLWGYFYGKNLISKRFLVQDSGLVILCEKTVRSVADQDSQYSTYLMRIDAKGDTVWTRRYSNGSPTFLPTDISPTTFGFVITGIAARNESPFVRDCPFLIAVSPAGDSLKTVYYDNITDPESQALVAASREGGYLIATSTRENNNIVATSARPVLLR